MSDMNFSDLRRKAKESGAIKEALPEGPNTFLIKSWGSRPNKTIASSVNWYLLVKVVGGPNDGATGFYSQTFGPEHQIGLNIWFEFLGKMGLSDEFVDTNDIATISEALVGRMFTAVAAADGQFTKWTKVARVDGEAAPAAAPQAPAAAPVPAPAPPQVPTAVPAPAPAVPAQAPVPQPAPAVQVDANGAPVAPEY